MGRIYQSQEIIGWKREKEREFCILLKIKKFPVPGLISRIAGIFV